MGSRRFDRIVATLSRRQPDLSIAMENVHKTRNFGALARTCDAVGIGVIHAITPDDSRVVLGHKTAGGTERWLSVRRHPNIATAYADFRDRGFTLLAADLGPDTVDFREVDYTIPTVIVVGSELDGLSMEAAMNADDRIHVPLMGMVESLNVSVAAGVILFEAARQRQQAGLYARRRISDEEYTRLLFEWLHPAVARYCRAHRRAYPGLDDDGEIREPISGNRRKGIRDLAHWDCDD
jgi:tRNA (guanosine-2'-O-)-methyltransferase